MKSEEDGDNCTTSATNVLFLPDIYTAYSIAIYQVNIELLSTVKP